MTLNFGPEVGIGILGEGFELTNATKKVNLGFAGQLLQRGLVSFDELT